MGWVTEDGEHEGWVPAVWRDGAFSVGSSSGQAMASRPGQREDGPELRDGRTAIGWQAMCECGWRGTLWRRVATPGEHDPDARRIHQSDPSPYGDAPAEVEDAIHAEWLEHVRPLKTLQAVREASAAAAAAERSLTDAVRAARAAGQSWAEIGHAIGITRQSAHERWAKHVDPAEH